MKLIFQSLAVLMTFALGSVLLAADSSEPHHSDIIAAQQVGKHVKAWRRYAFLGIPKVTTPPVIDGDVDAKEWIAAAALGYSIHMKEGMQVSDYVAWRICYTDTHFYAAWQFERPQNARKPGPRDFAELLLAINHDHRWYHNIAFNLEKELWSGIGPNVDKTAWTPEYEYKSRLTETGWEGEFAVAFTEFEGFDGAPEPGSIWGVDLVRNERSPTDRIAHWAWRGKWGSAKDLAHIVFTGEPVAIRAEQVGWLPQHKKMGVKVAVSNFSDKPVELSSVLDLRRATRELPLEFLPALDSAFTEDLDAAIGAQIDQEIERALEPFEVVDESNQKVVVPANSTKQLQLTQPDQPGNYLASFNIQRDDKMLAAMNVPFRVRVPLNIALSSYLYSANVLAYDIDLRRVQDHIDDKTVLHVEARVGKDGPVFARQEHSNIKSKENVQAEFKFEPISDQTYYVTAMLLQGKQQVTTNSEPLILPPKAPWIGSNVGRSKIVPKPWHDLVADEKHVDTLCVDYTWSGKSIFPSVKVKDKAIFLEDWQLIFKDAGGNAVPLELSKFELMTKDIENATYSFQGSLKNIGELTGEVTVSFDGFLWYDLKLSPYGKVDLTGCVFTAKLKPEYGRICTRGRVVGHSGNYSIPGTDCGLIPSEGLRMPFTFQTWAGYVEGGLQWYCENPKNWHNADPMQAVLLDRTDTETTLTVRYVDKPITLDKPIDWHFGLMPTPSKMKVGGAEDHAYLQIGGPSPLTAPSDEDKQKLSSWDYRRRVEGHQYLMNGYKEIGAQATILFSYNTDVFGYPGAYPNDKAKQLHEYVAHMHSHGKKVLVYNGWGMSTNAPEWEQYGSELVNLPLKNSGYNTYWGSPVSLYADLFVYRMAEHMREFDLDGIYMDSTLGVNYSTHPNGMRWTDVKGRQRGSYPVRAQRDFAMRIYKVLNHELGKDGIFYSHHSPPANVCVENFVNVRCPSEYAQFYDGPLDQDFLDFFLAKNGGIQFGYHTELTNKNWMRSIKKTLNQLNAIAVPAGVSFKAINFIDYQSQAYGLKDQPMSQLWNAFAWLDSKKATHYPWWADDEFVQVKQSETLSAVWLQKGERALVCVSNLPNDPRELTATLNLSAMGFKRVTLTDAITGEPVDLQDGSFTVAVEPERWRLIKVEPK